MQLKPTLILLMLFSILTPKICLGLGKIILIDKEQKMAAIDQPPDFKWQMEDYVCIQSGRDRIGCGTVTKVTGKGALVRMDYWTDSKMKVGDRVILSPNGPPGGRRTTSGSETAPAPSTALPPAVGAEQLVGDTPVFGPELSAAAPTSSAAAEPPVQTPAAAAPKAKLADSGDEVAKDLEKLNDPAPAETPPITATEPVDPRLEALQTPEGPAPETEAVNLEALDETPPAAAAAPAAPEAAGAAAQSAIRGHVRSTIKPRFRALFDLLFTYRPGLVPALTFDNYHSLLMFEFVPNPSIYFAFEIRPTPRYYELDYKFSPSVVLRLGRIFIPFDDLGPHSYFGGRANVSRLIPSGSGEFLPTLWADLGVGMHFDLFSSRDTTLSWDIYVVNGFQDGGTNPVSAGIYPNFSASVDNNIIQDNNEDKAIGTRLAGNFFAGQFTFGLSVYRDRYTGRADPAASIFMLGVDSAIKFRGTEIRAGYVYMNVGLVAQEVTSYIRGGTYAEFGQELNQSGTWKLVIRGGAQNFDSRISSVGDSIIVGAGLVHKAGPVTLSFEASEDLNRQVEKANYSYFALRATTSI